MSSKILLYRVVRMFAKVAVASLSLNKSFSNNFLQAINDQKKRVGMTHLRGLSMNHPCYSDIGYYSHV